MTHCGVQAVRCWINWTLGKALHQVADTDGYSQDQVSQSPRSSSDKGVGTESSTNVTSVSFFALGGEH